MEILWPPDNILEVVAVIVAVLVGLRLGARSGQAAVGLVRGAIRFVQSRRTPEPVCQLPDWPADWPLTLTLLVRVDEREGLVHPSVQVRGPADRRSGRIRLELVDPDGEVRVALERGFPAEALNAELPLASFAAPVGASFDEVLRWRWDVVLSGASSELRWRERPVPAGGLNPEAELLKGGGEGPVEPARRRFSERSDTNASDRERAGRRAALRKRAARLLLAIVLIAYIIFVYSGPTGPVSPIRALLLYGAFVAIWVALWALGTALFASDAQLAPDAGSDA